MTSSSPAASEPQNIPLGLALGMLGVITFAITLPVTRIVVMELDPLFVTIARALMAATMAAVVLLLWRVPFPPRHTLLPLFLFGCCVTIGYPILMGTAMRYAPASHGGVVLAVQPLITAVASVWLAGERPSIGFWICSIAGSLSTVLYAVLSGAGQSDFHWADLLLAGAAIMGSVGYTIGGRLTHRLPGWQVISWALIVMTPVLLVMLAASPVPRLGAISATSWIGLGFLGAFPMYLGFFAWNRGLAIGGIARVGQTQLIQPFITLTASALLLGEHIGWLELGFATIVVILVAVGARMRVAR